MARPLTSRVGRSIAVLAVFTLLAPASAWAQVIDFETVPGGGATVDQQLISTEYLSLGVTFTLLNRTTGLPIGSPRIAKVGAPLTAFEGCSDDDAPYPYLGLGQSFLTDGAGLGVDGDLRIEYVTPVAQASGVVLDIDCRTNGGPPCEQWTITSYDSLGAVLGSVVLDAPQNGSNPACQSPQAGFGDSEAFGWSFSFGSADIKSIVIRYTGTATDVGLGFDNFALSSVPVPLAVFATSPVDSTCAGEPLTLEAFPSGGLPPYTFQWEQETSPSSWMDLGTGSTQDVHPFNTTRYRVTVTDANVDMATSAEVTVFVDARDDVIDVLCAASLIVGSSWNHRVVRYSLRSELPQIMVPTGSGGLNNPSKLVFGPDGNLYVGSQANDRILRYDGASGAFIDIFVTAGSGGLDVPVGMAFGPDGNLYVSSNLSKILRFNGTTGAFIDAFVTGLNSPTGLVFGADDNLYVSIRNDNKVALFDGATGASLGDFVTAGSGGLGAPRGLTFGPDGNLYIGEETNDSVRRYNGATGAFIDIFVASGSGGLDRANDVVFAPGGVFYVASFNNDKVLGYDAATGAFLGALPGSLLDGPAWFAVGGPLVVTGVRRAAAQPLPLSIEQNVPNPFNPTTTVRFTLPAAGPVRVTVIDVTGRIVATLLDRPLSAGRHGVEWNADNAASGVYFVRVESGGVSAARKMVLLK